MRARSCALDSHAGLVKNFEYILSIGEPLNVVKQGSDKNGFYGLSLIAQSSTHRLGICRIKHIYLGAIIFCLNRHFLRNKLSNANSV